MSEPKDLYEVARNICHENGMPWYDPRTGQRHDPPGPANLERDMQQIFKRQAAIHAHAQTLECPECGDNQIQIMNLADRGKIFQWRCRHCHQFFQSGQE